MPIHLIKWNKAGFYESTVASHAHNQGNSDDLLLDFVENRSAEGTMRDFKRANQWIQQFKSGLFGVVGR